MQTVVIYQYVAMYVRMTCPDYSQIDQSMLILHLENYIPHH